ncbi:MAG: 2'-5' RNA ligase family protein [Flavobacteriales bacterium]|nr:2'-5' RNA ligase family protein [Flavobacteriales bacterium]
MKRWFFAILPSSKVSSEIIEFQRELKTQYGFSHALKTPPHLTIIPPFTATIDQIESLFTKIRNESLTPFSIQLDGFQAFHPRVLFVDVMHNPDLIGFRKRIKSIFVSEKIIPNKGEKHFFTPHITIANRDLNNKTFKQIFPTFKNRKFLAAFEVRSIFLLQHTDGKWVEKEEYMFTKEA